MIYRATVLNFSDLDEIEISIYGKKIICHLAYCSYKPCIGKVYDVELSLYFINDHNLEISLSESSDKLERISDSFGYYINGYLHNNTVISSSIEFEDDLLYEYSMFDSKNVCLKVDRIDLAFV
ncbi:hypothetical protein MMO39_12560 [Acinetobacter modestus]|uniref:hypothetical protein n=1 Tax=Acinetobacter modestus TaxID=1776740 RepID=UPI001F4AE2DE|nr:hypothetical protein [Acinetobacter modestus]MCH7388125.1 hypothetical protein [Acinetobacter modestus]